MDAGSCAAFLLCAAAPARTRDDLPPPAARAVDFSAEVKPILERACLSCHGPARQRSDYRLDRRDSALRGGRIGAAIVPGASAQSLLIQYVAGAHDEIRMPLKGDMLSSEEVGILRAWIDQGASWSPEEEAAAAEAPGVERAIPWSWRPLSRPPIPPVRAAHWVRTPVDAFVLAKLEERGMHFSAPADRRTLLRRIHVDLTGLPPAPEEMEAFLADDSPGAWERVVDRLLASPRYAERWARHWIDAVHFAETHGHDQDRPRPNAWPYRDWIIRSLDEDKSYARFVEEQLAGDVLFPEDPQATVALGFLAAGPWDESSQLNIVDDTADKAAARNLDRDDMLTTAASTFLSATVHCARCHDHKFDPITQLEYYRLQSVFAGVDRADRPFDLDPALHRRRQEILARRLEVARAAADSPLLATQDARAAAEAFERSLGGGGGSWRALETLSVAAAEGTTVETRPDGSLVFGGERPESDTYRVLARSPLETISAIRVELLPDETLPFRGPGRQDNGNLHLSELELSWAPAADPAALSPVRLEHASADFDQEGWTCAHAIDGDRATAWGIWPQVGRAHHAVFELAGPLSLQSGASLSVVLEQAHGRHHLIGRLRLSVSDAPRPVRALRLPEKLAAIVAMPERERGPEQRAELVRHALLHGIDAELAELPPPQLVYAGATDFAPQNNFTPARGPRPVRLLQRGEVGRPGPLALPAGFSKLQGLASNFAPSDPDDEGARRAALARWISDPRNPLTWRSIVNRVWHHHFGRGLVETLNDFGAMGAQPSHPELLDWLACWFLERGGSLKSLHRLLVTSAVYQQSSDFDPARARIDGDNRLLWRMNRARLDAETVRDAVLQAAGRLDLTMGGPSVRHFVESPGIHVTPKVDYDAFDVDSPASCRRSIYRFLFRTLPDPMMETLDCPDASQLAPVRSESVTPLQALTLLHNRFLVRFSEHVAERALREGGCSAAVDRLFELTLCRRPSGRERERVAAFAERHGLANVCRLLLNSSEFMFVD